MPSADNGTDASNGPDAAVVASAAKNNNEQEAQKKRVEEKMEKEEDREGVMKVTLLSGFLGAGKTTLLKRILRTNNDVDKKLRMAVIVNDMGEINLDADEIKNSRVVREDAEMVEMTNGCICCTLRGDLLKTVKDLSETGQFDYLVIESTGIGEPLPVAQTFAMDIDSMTGATDDNKDHHHRHGNNSHDHAEQRKQQRLTVATDEKKSLFHYAKLDTLVTVVDPLTIYDVLTSKQTLADKDNVSGMVGNTGTAGGVDNIAAVYPGGAQKWESDKEAVLVAAKNMPVERLRSMLQSKGLNATNNLTKPELVAVMMHVWQEGIASRYKDDRSITKLLLDQIEFANVIVVSKASQFLERNKKNGKNKLKQIEEMLWELNPKATVVVPSEDKYGDLDVASTLIDTGLFDMEEAKSNTAWNQELEKEDHNPETLEYGISSTAFIGEDMPFHPERLKDALASIYSSQKLAKLSVSNKSRDSSNSDGDDDGDGNDDDETEEEYDFRGVVRTKGQLWLANSNAFPVYFQTVGKTIEYHPGNAPFLVERQVLKSSWTQEDREVKEWMIGEGLWTEKFGDRRSQLVFIGVDLDSTAIHEKLKRALLTEEESEALGGPPPVVGTVQSNGNSNDGAIVEELGWNQLKDPFFGGELPKKCDRFYEYIAKKVKAEKEEENKEGEEKL